MSVKGKVEHHQVTTQLFFPNFALFVSLGSGTNFTQLLAAVENTLSGLLAFGSFSLNRLEDTRVIYHS